MNDRRRPQNKTRPSRGLTLIEVVVVISIIGLLIALLVPAVQSAREASRRVHCASNLRQLALAVNQYQSSARVFPAGNTHGHSFLVMILPYLEQKPLYDSINFSVMPSMPPPNPNDTAKQVSLAVLLCPSDPKVSSPGGATCYAGNQGVGFCKDTPYGTCENGFFIWPGSRPINTEAITDGTGATTMISEWRVSMGSGPGSWTYAVPERYKEPGQFEQFAMRCRDADASMAAPWCVKGREWTRGSLLASLYNHVEPINGHSCLNGGGNVQQGAWSAGSMHPGGANVAFADGHVRFMKDSSAPKVWRALGTRNGQEVISAGSY